MSQGFVNPYTYATSAPTVTALTSGSGTYTTPAGVKFLVVEMVGGGGGGGGSGTTGFANGGAGGNTTFGASFLTSNGGAAGGVNTQGGSGGGNTINSPATGYGFPGGAGGAGLTNNNISVTVHGGEGGVSFFAGNGGSSNQAGVAAGANTGSGGSGGAVGGVGSTSYTGAGGGAGGYLQAVITTPASSYSYSVGAGGAGGTAGTSGQAGGAGAAGIIIIYEYYEVLGIPTTLTLPLPVANGGTGISSATAYGVLCGGTTSTGAYQSIASVGTSGQVLTSNGAGALPTFQNAVAAATQADQETATSTTTYVSPGRQQFHPSAAKMWCYATYSGGTPVNNASYNQSSITDTNVGIMQHNFTVSFSSNNYVAIVTRPDPSNLQYTPSATSLATGSCQSYVLADNGLPGDYGRVICCFGDQ